MKIYSNSVHYNRSKSLAIALESVAASILPESVAWEVLVVDKQLV